MVSAYFILVSLCVFPLTSATAELKLILNSKTKIVDGVLYIFWNVNTHLHENASSPVIHFKVKYCPVDEYGELQDCKLNVTLCQASFWRLSFISGNISTKEDKLADYMSIRRIMLMKENSSAEISSEWNETSGQFMCALHNINECWIADQGWPGDSAIKKGQVLLTASTKRNYKEKALLEITNSQVLKQNLNQTKSIVLVQDDSNKVTVKWKACNNDNPTGFNITFQEEEGGKIIRCGPKLNVEYFCQDWEYKCFLVQLRPYTIYTVSVYSYKMQLNHESLILGYVGRKTFRTHEQAPSSPPSIECVVCNEKKLDDGNRMVKVMWKLPAKHMLNGLVRLIRLRYWAKNDSHSTKKTIIYRNMTTEGSIKLEDNKEYFVQVQICTLVDLCSNYSKPKLISKIPEEDVIVTSGDNSKTLSLFLIIVGAPLALFLIILGILYWSKQRKAKRMQTIDYLDNLQLSEAIEANDTKPNLGFPCRKESNSSNEYHELSPDALEVEQNGV